MADMLKMQVQVASCAKETFKDYKNNSERTYYSLFVVTPDGHVGKIFANAPHKAGDVVTLTLGVARDGKLTPVLVGASA